jgi:CRP-like cAMP-binding protein
LHAGDVFGEMSLIDDGPRSATVTAVGEVTTATITSWAFKSFAIERPELLWKMLVFQTARLRAEQTLSANLTA